MDALERIRAEYRRLDALLGIDTSEVGLAFSTRMVRQYGVCCFSGNRPTQIRLAAFLRSEPEQLLQTARHEYAHAAAALVSGRRHGHDALWKSLCVRVGCSPERLAKPCEASRARAEAYEKRRTDRKSYLVRCFDCGAQSCYVRRGKVVKLLESTPQCRALRCRRCGGRRFELTTEEKTDDKA